MEKFAATFIHSARVRREASVALGEIIISDVAALLSHTGDMLQQVDL